MKINKTYPAGGGGLNADDADFLIKETEYVGLQDFRWGSTDDGVVGVLECVGSTILVPNPNKPAGNNICIRGALDRPNRRAILCYWNDQGNHSIWCFDYINNRVDPMLLNSQVTGGLNFDQYHLVDGRVTNGSFYWTDALNEPRRINIQWALEMNFNPLNPLPGYFRDAALPTAYNNDDGTDVKVYYVMPTNPVPSYQSQLLEAFIIRKGNAGPNIGPTRLFIIGEGLNNFSAWGQYPLTKSYQQIILDGFANYFTNINPAGANGGTLGLLNGNPGAFVKSNWDWNLGDPTFAPTREFDLGLTNWIRTDGAETNPYIAPVSQSAISWIRRQPGLPPTQVKAIDSPLPTVNFVADKAVQACYRYQYKTFEYGTLSGLSTTADFNADDPPPIQTFLPVVTSSLFTNGYLATNINLPAAPVPGYGTGVFAYITRQGSGGSSAGNTNIPIPLDWTGFPATKSYTRIIVEGLANYFSSLPNNGNTSALTSGNFPQSTQQSGNWYISYRTPQVPCLNIKQTYDWGLGDSAFPPTTVANLSLYTQTVGASRQFNRVDFAIPFGEMIDQDVMQIDLIINDLISNAYSIIKSWQVSNMDDLAAINAHNAGTAQLAFSWYNNTAPIGIDPNYAIKQFDTVPNLCQTIEVAKNRGFMGNFTAGYNSQGLLTSLSFSQTTAVIGTPPGATITGEWYQIVFQGSNKLYTQYVIKTTTPLTNQPPAPQYYYTINNAAPPFPDAISSGIIFIGTTIQDIMTYYQNIGGGTGSGRLVYPLIDQEKQSALESENTKLPAGFQQMVFKNNSSYTASIHFRDGAGRKCGYITNKGLLISIPNTGFSTNTYTTALNWGLTNTYADQEIPEWAVYYSINLSKNLRTRFFVEAYGFAKYASKDSSGNWQFENFQYSTDFPGLAIDITFLNSNGMGYVFTQGDVMDFYYHGVNYSASIIAQVDQYVIMELTNIGQLDISSMVLYEIYTPYRPAPGVDEPHYECGQIFPISNPGTPDRLYSITQGSIGGDVAVFQRINFDLTYYAEAMSPNDKLYQYWFTNAGRSNNVDFIGKQTKLTSVCWSNTYIAGSQDNGLSTFDSADNMDLSPDLGAIMKLILASKVQKIGTVMLAICNAPAIESLYLGENTLLTATGASTIGQSNTVIGSTHLLKGKYGTLNPESVYEIDGDIYGFDVQSACFWQYADDGIFPISNYKLTRFAKLFADQYKSMTPAQFAALGSRPFVISCVDRHHKELLFTIPQTLATPPRGYLPDYPGTPYPFDFWDGRGKTISYKLKANPNKWGGSMSFQPDYMFELEDNLFLVKNGDVYRANSTDSFCNYFGTQFRPRVMPIFNQEADVTKAWKNLSVQANMPPALAYLMTQEPYVQATDLTMSDFQNVEGKFVAKLYKNKFDPKYNFNFDQALIKGEDMRGPALYAMLIFDPTQGLVQVKFINAGYELSEGIHLGTMQ